MNPDLVTDTIQFGKLVQDHFPDLTKSEKAIARFILKNTDEMAFLSAAELGEKLELSEATIVRFAQSLGFSGYSEMKSLLQDSFRGRVSHSVRLRGRLDDLRQTGDLFERLAVSEIDFLTEAIRTVDRDALASAVKLLQKHQRVFVFGLGPSTSLVDLLQIRLTRMAKYVIPLNNSGKEMLEPLLIMSGSDLLIAIGFFNITPNLRLVLDHARSCGSPVILITDTLGALIGEKADVILSARRGPVSAFHSLTVPMTIINAMLLSLSQVDQEKVMPHLDLLDRSRDHFIDLIKDASD